MRKTYLVILILFCFRIVLSVFYSCDKIVIQEMVDNINKPADIDDKEGKIIFVSDTLQVSYYKKFDEWHDMQGGAIYRDYLVAVMATDELERGETNGFIFDLRTGAIVSTLVFTSTLNGHDYMMPHANQVSFGRKFYNQSSVFPLLYVTQGNFRGGNIGLGEQGVLVYDIQYKNGSYTPVLVQIIIPDFQDEILMGKIRPFIWNWVVDNEHDKFVVIGYPNKSGPLKQPIGIFNIPDVLDGTNVVMTSHDLLEYYTLSNYFGPQQSFCFRSYCFSLGGYPTYGWLRIIDLERHDVIMTIDLRRWTKGEPQFIGLWGNRILYYEAGNEGQIYEFNLKFFNNLIPTMPQRRRGGWGN